MSALRHIFSAGDSGCFADGCHGHRHIRETLASMVGELPNTAPVATASLQESLRAEMPDDAWDEAEALELLNLHCTPDVRFELLEGDLMLVFDDPALWEGDY